MFLVGVLIEFFLRVEPFGFEAKEVKAFSSFFQEYREKPMFS